MTWSHMLRLAGLGVALGLHGCNPPSAPSSTDAPPPPAQAPSSPAPAPAPNPRPLHLNHAQPKLPTLKLWLGTNEVVAELALKQTEIATGMMFRKSMGRDEGMLFVFGVPHQTGFYMRNTTVPLSAGYIDPEGIILEIHDLNPLEERPVMAASDQIQYVLEMNQGWFKTNRVGVGTAIRTEVGTLRETFFRGR